VLTNEGAWIALGSGSARDGAVVGLARPGRLCLVRLTAVVTDKDHV
jgi:hypothetical protein